MSILKYAVVLASLSVTSFVFAQTPDSDIEAFQMMLSIPKSSIVVPTVVEIPLTGVSLNYKGFLVQEVKTGKFLPSYFKEEYIESPVVITAISPETTNPKVLVDADPHTMVDYAFSPQSENKISISLKAEGPVTSSKLILELDSNVALPSTVMIVAVAADGTEKIVVAEKKLFSEVINFPQTTSDTFVVTFSYGQPLRISELRLVQDKVESEALRSVRFLMQPNNNYVLYFNPDRTFAINTTEPGNLRDDEGVRVLKRSTPQQNPAYIEADVDGDGVIDIEDNCTSAYNADQEDVDSNGVGDECDDEESRLTERYVWVPWVGMGIAFAVLVGLFALVGLKPKDTLGS